MEDPQSGNTLLDVSRVLSNKAFRDMKLANCKNPIVVQFWKEVAEKAGGEASLANIVPYITSKFDVFLSNDIMRPIIAQENSTLNFREIMDNKKILLVNLSKGRLGDINANLIGLILVGKILMAALSRVDSVGKDMPPFYLYIDEFQNITTDSISTILSEARKYKLALNIAHQFIAQLEEGIRDSVFGNVGSIASFRVGAEDAEYLEKQFAPVFSTQDIMSIDNFNGYLKILANGRPVKPFNIETLPPPKGNRSIIESIKELSYLKYGREKTIVEQEIMLKYKK
jgi:type IV secretory pathway TraG/TraD family ATPase VirD4